MYEWDDLRFWICFKILQKKMKGPGIAKPGMMTVIENGQWVLVVSDSLFSLYMFEIFLCETRRRKEKSGFAGLWTFFLPPAVVGESELRCWVGNAGHSSSRFKAPCSFWMLPTPWGVFHLSAFTHCSSLRQTTIPAYFLALLGGEEGPTSLAIRVGE